MSYTPRLRRFAGAALALAFGSLVVAGTPVETFAAVFAPIECEAAALSFDGKHLASVIRRNGSLTVYVTNLEEMSVRSSVLLSKNLVDHRGDSSIRWLSDHRIIVQIGTRDIVAFDATGTAITWLIDWTRKGWFRPAHGRVDDPSYNPLDRFALPPLVVPDPSSRPSPLRRVRIVASPATEPDFVYVEGIGAGSRSGHDVALYRIHHRTGVVETIRTETVPGLLAYDQLGRPRLRLSENGTPRRWHLRAGDDAKPNWSPLSQFVGATDAGHCDISVAALFGSRSFPLGFGDDPNRLYLASNVGRDTYGIYTVDLTQRRRVATVLEQAAFDLVDPLSALAGPFTTAQEPTLIFDRFNRALAGVRYLGRRWATTWIDDRIAGVQRRLEARLPTYSVQIEQWDVSRTRFLVQIFSRSDPGAYAIYEPATDLFRRILPRASKDSPLQPIGTVPWELKRPTGETLTGEITMPGRPLRKPVPAVVFFRQSEWSRQFSRYNPQIAALAHLGFAVVEVNHRGLAGFGTKHWIAGRTNADAAAAEDAFSAIDYLASQLPLEQAKTILFGDSVGGYFALRAAQLFPERTQAVVARNPVMDLPDWIVPSVQLSDSSRLLYAGRSWFFGAEAKLRRAHSPLHQARALKSPTLIVTSSARASSRSAEFDALRKAAAASGVDLRIEPVASDDEPVQSNARTFVSIEKFLLKIVGSDHPNSTPQ